MNLMYSYFPINVYNCGFESIMLCFYLSCKTYSFVRKTRGDPDDDLIKVKCMA